jgi:hypothetical protein
LKEIRLYGAINLKVSQVAQDKFRRHLWYLSETLVGLSFFDRRLDIETKRDMLKKMNSCPVTDELSLKRLNLNPYLIEESSILDFVTPNTKKFFNQLFDVKLIPPEISMNFLHDDPINWETDPSYLYAEAVVQSLVIVNDIAERGVATMTAYNIAVTNSEEQKQNLLQSVEQHRKDFPTSNKKEILKSRKRAHTQ